MREEVDDKETVEIVCLKKGGDKRNNTRKIEVESRPSLNEQKETKCTEMIDNDCLKRIGTVSMTKK